MVRLVDGSGPPGLFGQVRRAITDPRWNEQRERAYRSTFAETKGRAMFPLDRQTLRRATAGLFIVSFRGFAGGDRSHELIYCRAGYTRSIADFDGP